MIESDTINWPATNWFSKLVDLAFLCTIVRPKSGCIGKINRPGYEPMPGFYQDRHAAGQATVESVRKIAIDRPLKVVP